MLWLKFFYFLRIFESTGSYVRSIIEVLLDMKWFLLILMLSFFMFGDAYKVMANANPHTVEDDAGFLDDGGGLLQGTFYTYMIGLGEF